MNGPAAGSEELSALAERVGHAAQRRGTTVGAAESLTGGTISATLAAAPEASEWYGGAVIAYSPAVKQQALGVRPGPVVSSACVTEMAEGVRRLLGVDLAVAVSGVGGPGPEEDQPAGTVWTSVAGLGDTVATEHRFSGDSEQIVAATVRTALQQLLDRLERTPS